MAKTAPNENPDTSAEGAGGAPLPDTYEAALAELEGLVGRMEGGSLSLEESLTAYRRGAALVAFCQQQLEKVEQQVRVLDGETLKPLPTTAADSGDDDL
jgi:exodeoxyribonuclease VII small subunit